MPRTTNSSFPRSRAQKRRVRKIEAKRRAKRAQYATARTSRPRRDDEE